MLEIARFWAGLASFNDQRGRYEIHGVVGLDEFHDSYLGATNAGLRNNAYTNVMAVWVLSQPSQCSSKRKGRLSVHRANSDADSDDARTLRPPHAATCTYHVTLVPHGGQKVFTVQRHDTARRRVHPGLCADEQGFSLHAAVSAAPTRASSSSSFAAHSPGFRTTSAHRSTEPGQVVLKLKTPRHDGTTHS